MHWTYKEKSDAPLEQGDILEKTDYLITEVLQKYHPYYASHKDNDFFIVLTQSCDLVIRNGECKAPYITLAPVRPLRVIIEREFHTQLYNLKPNSQPFGSIRLRDSYKDFLSKLFNNNDQKYFFIREQQDKSIAEDMCAITALSISIKNEHYSECLKARILQLDDTFQAKLGWLVGQQYSRVGTQDWPEGELNKKIEDATAKAAIWIPDEKVEQLKKAVVEYENDHQGEPVDDVKLGELIASIPEKKDQVISSILDVLESKGYLPSGPDRKKWELRKALRNDPNFSRFFKSS